MTNDDGRVLALRPEVSLAEVLRCLGYPDEQSCSDGVRARVADLWPRAAAMVHPRGAFRVVEGVAAGASGMPEPAEVVGVAVCSIGGELEAASDAASRDGSLLDALVLDAFGSAAAEACADALNLSLCARARTLDLVALPRVSPGYGDWDVAHQAGLLALLPVAEVGVSLTSGGMMVPRKSVSFASNLVASASVRQQGGLPCERCGMVRCRHRRVSENLGGARG